ncbi:MAG TPA: magnesium transporter CorA family protein [Kofleriaceae bacterium]|nr:magnesium transporter CorA family protein [Kofleriaceae bacterium]
MAYEGFTPWVVEMDFEKKTERTISLERVGKTPGAQVFSWIDITVTDAGLARPQLAALDLMEEDVLEDALSGETGTQHARYPRHLHIVMTGVQPSGRELGLNRVDVIVCEHSLITVHDGSVNFVDAVKRDYREDFLHHARTPSFLVYELWDHLLDSYVVVQNQLEDRVEAMEATLIGAVDDDVFRDIAELSSSLLHFRKILMPARAVLTDLSSRKSRFVSEATQPFLANMVGTVERILQDVVVAREILANSLNLYMSVVGHRTNEVMRRLTVVSVIFLPLTFLVGVYGMNFGVMPELSWKYGYLAFWVAATGLATGLMVLLRRKRFL